MHAVGILGGTFDPVHHGHLRLAIECREKLSLHRVHLVPLGKPPHREPPHASTDHRLQMLQLATRGIEGLKVDEHELSRGGVSYTIDTVRQLRMDMPDTPLCLITGRDAFNAIHTWREWQSIPDYVHIIVVGRPGHTPEPESVEIRSFLAQHRVTDLCIRGDALAGHIYEIEIPELDISATRIRQIIRKGNNPRGLLPESVVEFIYKNRIYPVD